MQITAKSKYDFQAIKSLTHLGMFKKANPKKCMALWAFIFVFLFAVIITISILWNDDSFLLPWLSLMVVICLLGCYIYFILPRIQYKNLCKFADLENTYTFTDDKFEVFSSGRNYTGSSSIDYTMLFKVYETSKYLFIYRDKAQCFMVDKSTMQGGSPEEIRRVLSNVLGRNYIVCNY